MGTKSSKIMLTKKNDQKFQNNSKKDFSKINLRYKENSLSNFPNPIFKNYEKVFDSYCLSYEIYELKDINNAFYLIFISKKEVIIYKYLYENKNFKKINSIKNENTDENTFFYNLIIKYVYNHFNNKKYIFIFRNINNIEIYQIKNEKKFKLIKKEESLLNNYKNLSYDDYLKLSYSSFDVSSYIDLFEVIYNQYDKNIYIIVSFYIKEDLCLLPYDLYKSNNIKIFIFKNNKLNLIKEFSFNMNTHDTFNVKNIIYDDKYSKKYYIINITNEKIQLIEIKQNYEFCQIENLFNSEIDLLKLKEFYENKNNFKACVIYDTNKDYLFITDKKKIFKNEIWTNSLEGNLIKIDLLERKIIKNIELNVEVNSIINWNNKALIIESYKLFYVFDIRINKIISKYSNLTKDEEILDLFKPFINVNQNFYGLFFLKNNILNFYYGSK